MTVSAPPAPPAAQRTPPAPAAPRRRRPIAPYLMVAPLVLVLAGVLLVPLVRLIVVSFQKYGLDQLVGGRPSEWVGLDNYGEVLAAEEFWSSLWHTVRFLVIAVGLTIGLGLLLAHLLAKVSRSVRVIMLLAMVMVWAMPPIIAMPMWRWLIDQRFGVLNYTLFHAGVLPTRSFNWFSSPVTGWTVICAIVVWGALPFVVISLHAALTAVPGELVEAARLDGAGAWRVFTAVTFPAIKPTVLIITVLSIIWDYRVFAQIWLLRDIGANKDTYYTIGIWSYVESFSNKNFGLGAAISLISVVLLGAFSIFAVRSVLRTAQAADAEADAR
ncbi:ABC transporter permease subunit [Nakamurella sp. YIM 132087]|uniref:ABC transporter permease subunit n=1 Tax=Nakamurella alba TaxID=2665158 RepID=A0A7K1FGS5_9ACTN|nr:sugar ABC transporter permease [Nakamurella alba]MTD13312.1 ABC transporter permease subunit [Nakamurella alba]